MYVFSVNGVGVGKFRIEVSFREKVNGFTLNKQYQKYTMLLKLKN